MLVEPVRVFSPAPPPSRKKGHARWPFFLDGGGDGGAAPRRERVSSSSQAQARRPSAGVLRIALRCWSNPYAGSHPHRRHQEKRATRGGPSFLMVEATAEQRRGGSECRALRRLRPAGRVPASCASLCDAGRTRTRVLTLTAAIKKKGPREVALLS